MTVTLTITFFQDFPVLLRTLESIAKQARMPDEIIVADDGSEERMWQELSTWANSSGLKLIHVWHPKQGFRKCELLNKAATIATSDYILYQDHDCLAPGSFVRAHVGFARPDMIHLGPRIDVLPPCSGSFRISMESMLSAVLHRNLVGWREAIRRARVITEPPRIIQGCNMLVPSGLLRRINGFDDRFRSWGFGEDAELAVRGWHAGCRLGLAGGSASVFHLWHPSRAHEGNRALFDECVRQRVTRCEAGLDRHLNARTVREVDGCFTRIVFPY